MTCCPNAPDDTPSITPVRFDTASHALKPAHVSIPGGTGIIGTSRPLIHADGEGPLRQLPVSPFLMSRTAITNADFSAFVADTGYTTEAERIGWSFVFWSQVDDSVGETQGVPNASWWRRVDGASWRCISGPQCNLMEKKLDHPVVHISWNDAMAYCSWLGARLPTELEWEHAARAGQGDVSFPWGNAEPDDESFFPCNIWQGRFPQNNTANDGYLTTAPAATFEPNTFGLYNMAGNVWEWTSDMFSMPKPSRRKLDENIKVAKGGSFLCHKSYCFRYRIAARIGNHVDSATTHLGFRVVWDI